MRTLLVVLSLAFFAGGCIGRSNVSATVENRADETVTLWLYKTGSDVERHLMSPGTMIAVMPATAADSDEPAGPPAVQLPPGQKVTIGPVKGRFGAGAVPTVGVFKGTPSLGELASEPQRTSRVARVPLGPGPNLVIVESTDPVRALRQTSVPTE
ncbi:MAG: hypothetical protein AAF561_01625 [Planctomycetota bacterium]